MVRLRGLRWASAGTLVAALASFLACSDLGPTPEPEVGDHGPEGKLNVLLILVDDLNTHLETYGQTQVRSPNIDGLAARGIRFDRAYAQYPVCDPSRTSLFSGLYPEVTRVFQNRQSDRQKLRETVFLPEAFQRQGYVTAGVGKILHSREAVRWSPELAEPELATETEGSVTSGDGEGRDARSLVPEGEAQISRTKDGGRTSAAINWLERVGSRPFFFVLGLSATHLPFTSPNRIRKRYPLDLIEFPAEPPGHLNEVPAIALTETSASLMTGRSSDVEMTDELRRKVIRSYYSCITLVDEQVGRLMAALDRLGLTENTIVVLTSDHGFHLGEHGMWRKMSLFEESVRVPLILSGPGVSQGFTTATPVELVDLYPTLVDLAGVDAPRGLNGLSLVPFLKGSKARRERPAYTIVRRGESRFGRSVRTANFRYTEWDGEELAQLYDHREDPLEYRNLAQEPSSAGVFREHQRLLRDTSRRAAGGS